MFKENSLLNTDCGNQKTGPVKKFVSKWGLAYAFLLPAIVAMGVYLVYPVIWSFVLSFQKWDGLGTPEFVGFKNYIKLFKMSAFKKALSHTLYYSLGSVTLSVLLGLGLALAIERRVWGWQFYKFVFYISVMLSTSVVGIMFVQLLEPNTGIFNKLLDLIGLSSFKHAWLADFKTALPTVVFISVWKNSGFTMLLFLAAMEGIDPSIHEAATLDGVTTWQRIIHIILPIIKRPIFVVILLQLIFSLKAFDTVWIVTKGGPGGATELLTTLLFRNATEYMNYGLASAISVVMIIVIAIVTIIYLMTSRLGNQVVE